VVAAPSPAAGLRRALRLPGLVLAGWLVSVVACAPVLLGVVAATARVGAHLPAGPLPAGDGALILLETLRPVAGTLLAAAAWGLLVLAAWSALGRAAAVRWWLANPATRFRLAELVRGGVGRWWRQLRLALTAVVGVAGVLTALWLPLWRLAATSSGALGPALAAAAVVSAAVLAAGWSAALHGAWLLGGSGRRSALLAWLGGLGRSLRRPWAALAPLLLWAVPGFALPLAPLLIDSAAALPFLVLAMLLGALCRLALLFSYAPATAGSSEEFGSRNSEFGMPPTHPHETEGVAGNSEFLIPNSI
jgi:hypothetical protein